MRKIGLFFGSFNPIHVGHLIVADAVAHSGFVDQVWFVVSPQNPTKKRNTLAHEQDRYDMVALSIASNHHFSLTDIEFHLPKPSYTIDTLRALEKIYPQDQFLLIMGQDNIAQLPKWKAADELLKKHEILVYPRPDVGEAALLAHPNVHLINAPTLSLSATYIREALKNGRSVKYLLDPDVIAYIQTKGLYQHE